MGFLKAKKWLHCSGQGLHMDKCLSVLTSKCNIHDEACWSNRLGHLSGRSCFSWVFSYGYIIKIWQICEDFYIFCTHLTSTAKRMGQQFHFRATLGQYQGLFFLYKQCDPIKQKGVGRTALQQILMLLIQLMFTASLLELSAIFVICCSSSH